MCGTHDRPCLSCTCLRIQTVSSLLLFSYIHMKPLVIFSYSCSCQSKCRSFIFILFPLQISLIQLFPLITSLHGFSLSQIFCIIFDLFKKLMVSYLSTFLWPISNSYDMTPASDLGWFQFAEEETRFLAYMFLPLIILLPQLLGPQAYATMPESSIVFILVLT